MGNGVAYSARKVPNVEIAKEHITRFNALCVKKRFDSLFCANVNVKKLQLVSFRFSLIYAFAKARF